MIVQRRWHFAYIARAGTLALAGCAATATATAAPARGRAADTPIDVAATTLPQAVAELARETGVSIGTEGALPPVAVRPVRGTLSVDRALARMLAGTGLRAERVADRAWRIVPYRTRPAPTAGRAPPPAPPPAEPPPGTAPPIIVTATKEVLPLADVPAAIAVVVPARLPGPAASAGTGAFAAATEGLAMTGEGPGRNRMFVRGVADSPFSGRTQSTVAVLLGDARVTWSAPDPDIRLVDVKQVELLKGPQGSLYGSGALGGIYRIVPNRADLGQRSLSWEASGSILGSGDAGVSGSAVLNLPFVRDAAALRLVAYGERIPGWIDTGTRTDGNREVALGWRANLAANPGDWRIDLTGLGQALHSADSGYVYAPRLRTRPAQVAEPHANDLLHGAVRAVRDGGAVTMRASTGLTRQSVTDRYDAAIGAEGFGIADPARLDDPRTYTVWDSELRANGMAGRVRWLAGLSWLSATQRETRTLTGARGQTLVLDADHRQSTEGAVYGQATLPILPRLDLSLGGRLFRATLDELRTRALGRGERVETRWGLTPSVRLAWQPRPARLFYAAYDSAIREGGATVAANGALSPIDGDELQTFSAGWRESAGPVRLDIGLYHSRWRDVQSDVLRSGGLIEPMNVGDGAITGAELSANADIAPHWRAEAGAMVQSALLDSRGASAFGDDRRLPVVPRSTARLALAHDVSIGPWRAAAQVRVRYVGKGRLSFDPALDRPVGGYLDSDAELRASNGPWAVAIAVHNLADSRGEVFAYGNPLRVRSAPQYVTQEPRAISLSLSWNPHP